MYCLVLFYFTRLFDLSILHGAAKMPPLSNSETRIYGNIKFDIRVDVHQHVWKKLILSLCFDKIMFQQEAQILHVFQVCLLFLTEP